MLAPPPKGSFEGQGLLMNNILCKAVNKQCTQTDKTGIQKDREEDKKTDR